MLCGSDVAALPAESFSTLDDGIARLFNCVADLDGFYPPVRLKAIVMSKNKGTMVGSVLEVKEVMEQMTFLKADLASSLEGKDELEFFKPVKQNFSAGDLIEIEWRYHCNKQAGSETEACQVERSPDGARISMMNDTRMRQQLECLDCSEERFYFMSPGLKRRCCNSIRLLEGEYVLEAEFVDKRRALPLLKIRTELHIAKAASASDLAREEPTERLEWLLARLNAEN